MATKELNQNIKSGNFLRAYLFFGPEAFLMHHWQKRLLEAVLGTDSQTSSLNLEVFDNKVPVAHVISAAETLPFMAEYRIIMLKNSGLFEAGRKDDAEEMADFLAHAPESTIIIFVEEKADKRLKLYKRVKEIGFIGEADTPKPNELAQWAIKLCASRGKALSSQAANYLIHNIQNDMQLLYNELEKLIGYTGDQAEITTTDIDAVCTKSLDIKIFDLMKAVGTKNARTATQLYKGLIALKESPFMILAMIARQYRFYLQCQDLAKSGMATKAIAAQLGLHPFATENFVAESRRLPTQMLINSLNECLSTDYVIKMGEMGDVAAVEFLIIKLCGGLS